MAGDLLIDGVDVYSTYGAYVTYQGYNSFVAWPSTKPVSTTEWKELNGEDVDLSALPLAARELTISFALRAEYGQISTFYAFLYGKIYRTWEARSIGARMPLRVVGVSSIESAEKLQLMTVRLSHDDPYNIQIKSGNTWIVPSAYVPEEEDNYPYTIDGYSFRGYGAQVIYGTRDSLLSRGDIKPYMLRDVASADGIIADSSSSISNTYKSTDHEINFVMYADTLADFWKQYYGLLWAFMWNPEYPSDMTACQHYLSTPYSSFYCYYKSQNNMEIGVGAAGKIWATFGVTIHRI